MNDDAPSNLPPEPLSFSESEFLIDCYRSMQCIRRVEERLCALFADGEIPGFIHVSIGQESVPVGISRHLSADDTIAITHRGHGQAIAKGVELAPLFAEMMGRRNGICKGRAGSMHIADTTIGMLGANGIVGGGIPIAAGSALAHKLDATGNIAVAYFGDGALAEGIFHECLNLCALWSLPCLFVCENNGWGEFSRTDRQFRGNLKKLTKAFGVDYQFVDGIDVGAVAEAAGQIVAAMRAEAQPCVLECKVERFHGHFEGDPQKYRDQSELEALAERDPILHLRHKLVASGIAEIILDDVATHLDHDIDKAVETARAGAYPDFAEASSDVYAR
jgi:acetoin:2,6-dichlorophenolindophenol oxidoreductase subunit alpha